MVKIVIIFKCYYIKYCENIHNFSIVFGIYGNKEKEVNEIESNYLFHRIIDFCENLTSSFSADCQVQSVQRHFSIVGVVVKTWTFLAE